MVIPTVTDQVFVHTNPPPPFIVPCSTKTKDQENSVELSISTALVKTNNTPIDPATVHLYNQLYGALELVSFLTRI